MEQCYLVRDRLGHPTVLACRDHDDLFEWSPATRRFHAAPWLDEDFFGSPPRMSYEEVDLERAMDLARAGIGKVSPEFDAMYRESTSEDMLYPQKVFGEEIFESESPSERAGRIAARLRFDAELRWDFYASYPKEKRANAYAAANQIRSGRIKAFGPAGSFDARAAQIRGGNYVVHVRFVGTAEAV